MNRIGYLSLIFILLISLFFRLYVNYFIPINQQGNLLVIFMGLANLILIFYIIQRLVNYKVGLLAALLYAISPWTAYLEIAANSYIILLTLLLVLYLGTQVFNISKKFSLMLIFFTIAIFICKFNQITIFSDVGLINTVNSFRGEINQTIFVPLGKIIENRYIYLSEHLLFNTLKQFTPATYFTNQAQLLGFSNASPIYLGLIIPFLFGFIKFIKSISKSKISEVMIVIFLLLPSILSKDSPDLFRLVLVSPIIFFIISNGIYEFILNYKRKVFRFLLLLTVFMVILQFFATLSDIATREPVRLQMFLGQQ
ncbi:hypothetical protein KKE03_01890 [Patescibacteria group bacterium]|nr:hypothetical protein [Patescibacteria group bacterium]